VSNTKGSAGGPGERPAGLGREKRTDDFASMVRQTRKQQGLTQQQLAARIETEEGRAITQSYLADIEAGHHPDPRPHLIEEFARALSINRYVLYLAARAVPPEVAEQLARLTPAEREAAWGAFMRAINAAADEKKTREQTSKGKSRSGETKKD
jgi:transcriptional regulator with XRE-family HTH domain